jgi:hypothetical protein
MAATRPGAAVGGVGGINAFDQRRAGRSRCATIRFDSMRFGCGRVARRLGLWGYWGAVSEAYLAMWKSVVPNSYCSAVSRLK